MDRFVSHLDAMALATVEKMIGELILEENPVILDLMAGWDSHPPTQEATASWSWRNAGVLRSLGEGGLELRRVTPHQRCHGLLPVGLHIHEALHPSKLVGLGMNENELKKTGPLPII